VSSVNMIIRFAIMNVVPFIMPFDRTDGTFVSFTCGNKLHADN